MITLDKITKTFDQRVVFNQINFTFEAGKVYALIGRSGSGKTTLLNLFAKLDQYDAGEIYYQQKPLKKIKTQKFFRDELGYLFQNFGILDSETIATNLELGLMGKKLSRSEKEKLEKQALQRVGLAYLSLNKKIYSLSGGEAQRVALAKLILKDPPLILADEPTASLDPKTSKEVMSLLLSLKNEKRLIIIATHNPVIWEMADEIVTIDSIANVAE